MTMNVTFRQLRLFLALADTGSVSAAARLLHVTQPTASMQLREIAGSVGLPLYEVATVEPFIGPLGGIEYYKILLRRAENQTVGD